MVVAMIEVLLPAASAPLTVTLLLALRPLEGNEPELGVAAPVLRLQLPFD